MCGSSWVKAPSSNTCSELFLDGECQLMPTMYDSAAGLRTYWNGWYMYYIV